MSEPRKLNTGSASGGFDQSQYEAARRRAHPHHVMVAPLDIHGMVFAQSIHNNMRAGTSVVNITDDMQMIDDQLLDQVA